MIFVFFDLREQSCTRRVLIEDIPEYSPNIHKFETTETLFKFTHQTVDRTMGLSLYFNYLFIGELE